MNFNESNYIYMLAHMLDESMGVDILHTPFTKKETDTAVKIFGITTDLKQAGWILPDGRLLDFNRDYHKKDHDDWDEHMDIRKAFSPERQAVSDGISGQKFGKETADAIMAACFAELIRIGGCPSGFYCDIGVKPTPAQFNVLYDCADTDWQCDRFTDHEDYISIIGRQDLVYSDYDDFSRRLVNDIKRVFA